MSKYYTIDEIIKEEQEKIEKYEELLSSEFISDYYAPGGFRKPNKDEIKGWKERLKYSQSIIMYLKKLK